MILRLIKSYPYRSAALLICTLLLGVAIFCFVYFTPKYMFDASIATCRVPDLDPYDASILPFIEDAEEFGCSDYDPLTFTATAEGRQVLHVDEKVLKEYDVPLERLQCCYSVITRISDYQNRETDCVYFSRSVVLGRHVQFLFVLCNDTKDDSELYRNMHVVVQAPGNAGVQTTSPGNAGVQTTSAGNAGVQQTSAGNAGVQQTSPGNAGVQQTSPGNAGVQMTSPGNAGVQQTSPVNAGVQQSSAGDAGVQTTSPGNASVQTTPAQTPGNATGHLNVLILGIDSMSRMNMIRTMPLTVDHLKATDWLDFKEYNKVGDNTVPNLLAILAGTDEARTAKTNCYPKEGVNFDNCPYIWNDFRAAGYYTAYAEDRFGISTFNYKGGGFLQQPTDFYARAYVAAATEKLEGSVYCYGLTSVTDTFLKLTLDLATTHPKLFSLVWLNNFSHDDMNSPSLFDGSFVEFVKTLKHSGVLEDTLVLFLSDHGNRWGDMRSTYEGWLEERLPFFFMWVPEWFRAAHPIAHRNLKARRGFLTSPYDVHLTLREIVEDRVGAREPGCQGCPTCRSMFSAPLKDRACADAGISSHWCACAPQELVSNSSHVVVVAARHAVDVINARLGGDARCARMSLGAIREARRKFSHGEAAKRFNEYVVVFATRPGTALYDASVRVHEGGNYEVVGLISRINSYEFDSRCVEDKELKMYCQCVG